MKRKLLITLFSAAMAGTLFLTGIDFVNSVPVFLLLPATLSQTYFLNKKKANENPENRRNNEMAPDTHCAADQLHTLKCKIYVDFFLSLLFSGNAD